MQNSLSRMLSSTPFLSPSLKLLSNPRTFFFAEEGKLIYSFDDKARDIYLVVEGEVKIKFCDNRSIVYKHPSDFFGEKEILEKTNRVSFAIANKDCKLYRIEAEELDTLSMDNNVKLNKVLNAHSEKLPDYIEQLS